MTDGLGPNSLTLRRAPTNDAARGKGVRTGRIPSLGRVDITFPFSENYAIVRFLESHDMRPFDEDGGSDIGWRRAGVPTDPRGSSAPQTFPLRRASQGEGQGGGEVRGRQSRRNGGHQPRPQ